MEKLEQLYEGRAKKVFATDDPAALMVEYKDVATAFNGLKRARIPGKGSINNRVTNYLMQLLEKNGVPTHFIQEISERETLVKKVDVLPMEVIVRNIAAGSLSKRLGLPEGTPMRQTVLEYRFKNEEMDDPLVNEYHIAAMGWATPEQVQQMAVYAFRVNEVLRSVFKPVNIELVDFKLEFGTDVNGKLVLADEISPDTCRFWDSETREKLDKDRFRRDMGDVEEAYQEIIHRLMGV